MPWRRWIVLKVGVLFTRVFSRIKVSDTHNGLRAFSREALQKMRITQNRMAHASEILDEIQQHALRFREVPVTIRYDSHRNQPVLFLELDQADPLSAAADRRNV